MAAPGTAFKMEEHLIGDVPKRVWKDAPPTLCEVFIAGRMRGDKTYLVYEDERATFELFARAALTIAAAEHADGGHKGGLPRRQPGEEPVAVVTIKPGMGMGKGEDELRAFVRGRIAAFKVPVRIVMLRETLPRNANGKIIKNELRPLFGDVA